MRDQQIENRSLFIGFILFLIMYSFFILKNINAGLASIDAHGVISAVNRLVATGVYVPSRPPAHPTTEVLFLFPLAFLIKALFHQDFSWKAYLLFQFIGGILALGMFYKLLALIKTDSKTNISAVIILGLSTIFVRNILDGEEFLYGIFFLFITVYFLILHRRRGAFFSFDLLLAAFSFALATGCRNELVFAVWLFFVPTAKKSFDMRSFFMTVILLCCFLLVVWLPVCFRNGLQMYPFAYSLDLGQRIFSWGYKLIFKAFGLFVFAGIGFGIIRSLWFFFKRKHSEKMFAEKRDIFIASLGLICIYILVFLWCPLKSDFLLPVLPCALLLFISIGDHKMITGLLVLSLMTFIITPEIIDKRRFVGLHSIKGEYFKVLEEKPLGKMRFIDRVLSMQFANKSIVILACFSWDFEYYMQHQKSGRYLKTCLSTCSNSQAYCLNEAKKDIIVFTRSVLGESECVAHYFRLGYDVFVDQELWRQDFLRYKVFEKIPGNFIKDGIPYTILR